MSYNELISETKLIRATDISPDNPPNLGIRIEIIADPDPVNPREEFDHVATMVCWHRNYNLGDEQPKETPDEYLTGLMSSEIRDRLERIQNCLDQLPGHYIEGHTWTIRPSKARTAAFLEAELDRGRKEGLEPYVFRELYLYDHGSITICTAPFSCPWDSGQVGFIYVSKADAIEKYGISSYEPSFIKLIENRLDDEVKEYDDYLTGTCYGYRLTEIRIDEDGGEVEQGELDSCWGFLDDSKYAMEEAESQVEFYMDQIVRKYLAEHGPAHRQLELEV